MRNNLCVSLAALLQGMNCAPYLLPDTTGGASLDIYADGDTITMTATVKIGTWLGFGWGPDMDKTSMIEWSAGTTASDSSRYATQLWAPTETYPDTVDPSCYTTTWEDPGDGFIVFTSTRPLDCGEQGYLVPLDTDSDWIFAWDETTSELSYHGKNRIGVTCQINSHAGAGLQCGSITEAAFYIYHGFAMWGAWTILGLLQIYTNRYWKHFWRWRQTLHTIAGILSSLLVMIFGFIALSKANWKIPKGYHYISGFVTLIATVLLMLGGFFNGYILKAKSDEWGMLKMIKTKAVHKYFGLLLVVGSQFTQASGIALHFGYIQEAKKGQILWILNTGFFFLMLILGEVIYRINLSKQQPFEMKNIAISKQEFEDRVKEGEKLAILDGFVVNIGEFMDHHPGGKFMLSHNVGCDISKFFYGGYSMEGNLTGGPNPGHVHSNYARMIVNDLIVGQYEKQITVQSTICKVRMADTKKVNDSTAIIHFESEDKQVVPNFREFHAGLGFQSKHFLIRCMDNKKLYRHYTICNAMRPEIYKMYVDCLNADSGEGFDVSKLKQEEGNTQMVCVKNYGQGVSGAIHTATDDKRFELQGPLGKGLMVQPTGVHIAFAAGTGILCFVDLIAAISRQTLGIEVMKVDGEQSEQLDVLGGSDRQSVKESIRISTLQGNFKLFLYVSFPNRDDSIALELCEALANHCNRRGKQNFDLFTRISQEGKNPRRWDEQFICDQFEQFEIDEIKKVWVCGPPVMQETFDRAIHAGKGKLAGLSPDQFEIL